MGHRMEIYVDEKYASNIIEIAKADGIDAKIIGEVSKSDKKKLSIQSELGNFEY
jgi:phosphoribosylformylglycinamidine cyclo-ligase